MNNNLYLFDDQKTSNVGDLINSLYKKNNEKFAFTNGCFDVLHYGHFKLLYESSRVCNRLVVGINSDKSIKKIKGNNRPIHNQYERAFMLNSLIYVDFVIIFSQETPRELIKEIKPNYLIKGDEYQENEIIGREFSDTIIRIPMIKDFSTTNIINKIKKI